jgi:hypothetical protein
MIVYLIQWILIIYFDPQIVPNLVSRSPLKLLSESFQHILTILGKFLYILVDEMLLLGPGVYLSGSTCLACVRS